MSRMDFYMEDRSGKKKPVDIEELSRHVDRVYRVEFQGENVRSTIWAEVIGVEALLLANCHGPEYNRAIVSPLYDEREEA